MLFAEYAPFLLAVVIALVAVFQHTDERLYAGSVFALTGLLHIVFFYAWRISFGESMGGVTYFVTAGVMSLIAMEWMARIPKIISTTISLYRVCLVEIVANIAGLVMWYNSIAPEANTYIFVAIRIWAILILIRKDKADDLGGYTAISRRDYLMLVFVPWRTSPVCRTERRKGSA